MLRRVTQRMGGMRWALVFFVLGIPLPFVLLALLMPGCR